MARRRQMAAVARHPDPLPQDGAPAGKRHDRMRAIAPTLIGSLITGKPIEYPAPPPPDPAKMSRRQRQRLARERRAAESAERNRLIRLAEADRTEKLAEQVAPAAQRKDVLSADGRVIRGARLEPDGLAFKRSNPLKHLAARSRGMEVPTIRDAHVKAAARLLAAWEIAGEGITLGGSNYGERTTGTPQTGYLSDAVLSAVDAQVRARKRVEQTEAHLGGLWPVINAIVIRGIDAASWAASVRTDRKVALGYLAAALDRLVEFDQPREPARQATIRAAVVVPMAAGSQSLDSDGPS